MQLPDTELLREDFGYIENQKNKVAKARASCIFDVLNKIVIKSKIDNYKAVAKTSINDVVEDLN